LEGFVGNPNEFYKLVVSSIDDIDRLNNTVGGIKDQPPEAGRGMDDEQ